LISLALFLPSFVTAPLLVRYRHPKIYLYISLEETLFSGRIKIEENLLCQLCRSISQSGEQTRTNCRTQCLNSNAQFRVGLEWKSGCRTGVAAGQGYSFVLLGQTAPAERGTHIAGRGGRQLLQLFGR